MVWNQCHNYDFKIGGFNWEDGLTDLRMIEMLMSMNWEGACFEGYEIKGIIN